MSMEIDIYDSEGRPYGGGGSRNEQIRDLFFADVQLALEDAGHRGTELTLFFRAKETSHGRAEQFFAVCRANDLDELIRALPGGLETAAESEGLHVERGNDLLQVFQSGPGTASLDDVDHRVALDQLRGGTDLGFGVRDANRAVALAFAYYDEGVRSVSVSSGGNADSSSTPHKLLLRYGDGRSFAPLDSATEQAVEQGKRAMESEIVSDAVGDIEQSVRRIQSQTSLTTDELRSRVHDRVPALKSPSTTGDALGLGDDQGVGPSSVGSDDGRNDVLVAAGAGLAALAAIVVIAAVIAALGIHSVPILSEHLGPAEFQDVSADGATNAITFSGNVTNAGKVNVTLGSGEAARTKNVNVTDGSFEGAFDPPNESFEAGNYTVQFTAGDETKNATATVDPSTGEGTESNETATESGGDGTQTDAPTEEPTDAPTEGPQTETPSTATASLLAAAI